MPGPRQGREFPRFDPASLETKKVGGKTVIVRPPKQQTEERVSKDQLANVVAGMTRRIERMTEELTARREALAETQTALTDLTAKRDALQTLAAQTEE